MAVTNLQINMPHLLVNLSTSLDFTQQGITDHHKRVAILALRLAQAAGYNSESQLSPVFQSAIIHDIGAISWEEKSRLTSFDLETPHQHCIKGSSLVASTKTLSAIDSIIRCHHDHWLGPNTSGLSKNAIPLTSRIIHLADRLDILIQPGIHILEQRQNIWHRLQSGAGTTFDPNLIDLLGAISQAESFWLELASPWLDESLTSLPLWQPASIGIDDLYDLANLFAGVIDYKSPFTHRHSHGVSMVASQLAKRAGLSNTEIDFITIAALLHDIGKLSVPDTVLEKPGSLSVSEMYWIKQHTYFTFKILQPLSPSTLIPQWAAFHHEKLNGHGYPFGYSAYQLDLPSRIIAIADIFCALKEDRPYRAGLAWKEIEPILAQIVAQGSIDPDLCLLLLEIRHDIDNHWKDLKNG